MTNFKIFIIFAYFKIHDMNIRTKQKIDKLSILKYKSGKDNTFYFKRNTLAKLRT